MAKEDQTELDKAWKALPLATEAARARNDELWRRVPQWTVEETAEKLGYCLATDGFASDNKTNLLRTFTLLDGKRTKTVERGDRKNITLYARLAMILAHEDLRTAAIFLKAAFSETDIKDDRGIVSVNGSTVTITLNQQEFDRLLDARPRAGRKDHSNIGQHQDGGRKS